MRAAGPKEIHIGVFDLDGDVNRAVSTLDGVRVHDREELVDHLQRQAGVRFNRVEAMRKSVLDALYLVVKEEVAPVPVPVIVYQPTNFASECESKFGRDIEGTEAHAGGVLLRLQKAVLIIGWDVWGGCLEDPDHSGS